MKYLALIFVLLIVEGGCATVHSSRPSMDLASVEKLLLGKITAPNLRARFGDPQKIFSFSKNEDTWIYEVIEGSFPVQKASFVLNRENGLVLTATWVPTGADPLATKANALAYFKNATFDVKEAGLVARHHWSNEATYSDPRLAISIMVNQTTGSVIAITFGERQSAASLASQK